MKAKHMLNQYLHIIDTSLISTIIPFIPTKPIQVAGSSKNLITQR